MNFDEELAKAIGGTIKQHYEGRKVDVQDILTAVGGVAIAYIKAVNDKDAQHELILNFTSSIIQTHMGAI